MGFDLYGVSQSALRVTRSLAQIESGLSLTLAKKNYPKLGQIFNLIADGEESSERSYRQIQTWRLTTFRARWSAKPTTSQR